MAKILDGIVYIVCVMSIASAVWYRYSNHPSMSRAGFEKPAVETEISPEQTVSPPESVSSALPDSSIVDVRSESTTDEWRLRQSKMKGYFTDSHIGHSLATVAALSSLENEASPHQSELQDAIADVERHPDEAIRELALSLGKLPDEYDEIRSFLLQFSTTLEAERAEKVALVRAELERIRQPAAIEKATVFGPTISFETLMQVTDDPVVLRTEVKALAKAYGNTPSGRTLRERYLARFAPPN